jgi:hypothetical protein
MTARVPANGQDMSSADFEDSAWDSNEMMREPGSAESPPEPDDDEAFDPNEQEGIPEGDEEDDSPELEADEQEGDDEQTEGEDDEESDGPEPIEPPSNWPAQERQFFANLPPQLQHAYMDRARAMTADYTRKTQAMAQERQRYQQFDQVIAPHVRGWALNGMAPAQAVSQLIELSNFASQSPQEFIKYFANLRGVDLAQMVQGSQDEYIDPQVAALRQPLAQVQSQLNQLSQQQLQWQREQEAQQVSQARGTISSALDTFASQTGRDGKPLYPHFDEVAETMAAYVNGGVRNLDQAYRMACQANPQIAARITARNRASENARRKREAEEARRAAVSVSGPSMGNGSIPTGDMGVRDLLHSAWRGEIQ